MNTPAKENLLTALFCGSKRLLVQLALVLIVCFGCSVAMGTTFVPPDPYSDLDDLDHNWYYTWGINVEWDTLLEEVETASLFFDNIRNWDNGPNDLYIHLLDEAPLGVERHYDGEGGGDNFASQGILLVHYDEGQLSSTPQDLVYNFSEDEVAVLNDYALDGRIALGFDPDCHFYNCGVELTLDMRPVPEPATLTIVGLGAVLLGLVRKARKS